MNRLQRITIPVFVGGFVFGCGFWFVFSPLLFDRVVSEQLPAGLELQQLRYGSFRGVDGAHRGRGDAQILKIRQGGVLLRLTDFDVTNGQALEAWLVSDVDPQKARDVLAADTLSLGLLHGNKGDQTYVVPAGTDISLFNSVVIWCARFGILHAVAPLVEQPG